MAWKRYDSPAGKLFLLGDDMALAGLFFARDPEVKKICREFKEGTNAPIRAAVRFLDAYFRKKAAPLPPLHLGRCSKAEYAVYRALIRVPFGKTVSYGELARRGGCPRGARFAGNTMAKNSIPVIIPCHRVIRSDGSMGNYTGGTDIKEFLLRHEGVIS
jgi:methylated-DNA-[protein]-cysteine S-methyltransferase